MLYLKLFTKAFISFVLIFGSITAFVGLCAYVTHQDLVQQTKEK